MTFKLLMMAEKRWRKVNSAHLVAVVQAGVRFPDSETRILSDMLQSSNNLVFNSLEATVS